jgi:hypothetical protein
MAAYDPTKDAGFVIRPDLGDEPAPIAAPSDFNSTEPIAPPANAENFSLRNRVCDIIEAVILGFYILEFLLVLISQGGFLHPRAYFRQPWNIVDFLVVVFAYVVRRKAVLFNRLTLGCICAVHLPMSTIIFDFSELLVCSDHFESSEVFDVR